MAFKFLAIDPDTPSNGSPTLWLDEENGDLIIQSYRADAASYAECARVGSVPGHTTDVPDHETIVRLPARLVPLLKAALQ